MAAQQPKYQSLVCEPQVVAEKIMAWEAKGYEYMSMAGFETGTGSGHGPKIVVLFKLKVIR